jgi:hypothetical protein
MRISPELAFEVLDYLKNEMQASVTLGRWIERVKARTASETAFFAWPLPTPVPARGAPTGHPAEHPFGVSKGMLEYAWETLTC